MNKVNIENAMRARLNGALSYEQFVEQAIDAGALYLSHAHHENTCSFHSADDHFSFELPYEVSTEISPSLDVFALKKAVQALDEGLLRPEQFHHEKALAGVSVTHVFLTKNRVFYLGLNGDFHLEEW